MRAVIDTGNIFIIIFLTGTCMSFLLSHFLESLDYRNRKMTGGTIPEILKKYPESEIFDAQKLKKITDYENEKYYSWFSESILSFILTICLVVFGFYVLICNLVISWFGEPVTVGKTFLCFLIYSLVAGIPERIIRLPFSIHREFVLEKKFGFSNMTVKLWIADGLKNTAMSLILYSLLYFAASFFFVKCPESWWIVLAVILMALVALINLIYPKFIAPIFNKFQPLEDGELKTRLENMLEKAGFSSDGLFVMDASKRSKHSNAYFSGFGKAKRIVLYDTLIKTLTVDEIESVMAHEVGHYKLHHITRRMLLMFPVILTGSFLFFKITHIPALYTGFGFKIANINAMQFVGIDLVIRLFSGLSILINPVLNFFSRRNEYAADRYSAKLCETGKPLITALIKLNSENLSELIPPKLYSAFHYSHPTLAERVVALEKIQILKN